MRRDAIRRNRRAPCVNSADQSETVPFPDIGDRYILAGAQYDPQVLAGLSQAQIASQLRNPDNSVAKALDGSANVVIAAIGNVLHHQAGQLTSGAGWIRLSRRSSGGLEWRG